MWGGRFKSATHPLVEAFTSSLPFDQRLYAYDIRGSIAWARALVRARVITRSDASKMTRGLRAIEKRMATGKVRFVRQDEDIHMAIERLLTERIGTVGAKLHTGRSRNDQVALDMRLYLRDESVRMDRAAQAVQKVLLYQAKKNLGTVMPGYTHLQKAQPVLLSHHLLAYVEMLERDRARLADGLVRIDRMPLGSGALAGTNYPIARERIARELGFSGVTQNSLDAVSDRDFILEFLSSSAVLMMHLSRLSEELVLWSSEEFGFVDIPDAFCTGSSLMPQKKNPDVLELIRGKTGRVYGNLLAVLTTLKALPLTYNRDLQEDKAPLFDTIDTLGDSLRVLEPLLRGLQFRKTAMRQAVHGDLLATDLADYLVGKGLPFRKAHEVAGRIVAHGAAQNGDLPSLPLKDFRRFSARIEEDVYDFLTVPRSLARKRQTGSTSPAQVRRRIRNLEAT
jgi:argininosuccinate lyase